MTLQAALTMIENNCAGGEIHFHAKVHCKLITMVQSLLTVSQRLHQKEDDQASAI